jgi:hypothetical protein
MSPARATAILAYSASVVVVSCVRFTGVGLLLELFNDCSPELNSELWFVISLVTLSITSHFRAPQNTRLVSCLF